MDLFSIDIAQIVDLGTQVAQHGAIRATDFFADDMFEYIVGIAILIHELDPR